MAATKLATELEARRQIGNRGLLQLFEFRNAEVFRRAVDSEPLYKLKGEFFKTLGHPAW